MEDSRSFKTLRRASGAVSGRAASAPRRYAFLSSPIAIWYKPVIPVQHTTERVELSEEGELQFEQAEYPGDRRAAGPQCDFCQHPIDAEYFQVNEQVACARCRRSAERNVCPQIGESARTSN